ncbi:hypothetical protein LJC45_00005 [Alistipes sp. OttesenSCG-928-B03]|nr:hypothetical protein [Alistipes sp. OttesenSCG-928-B03]
MKIRTVITLLALCALPAQSLFGQSTVSPYSFFGIGEIETGNYGENAGMGGLGIGFRQANSLNPSNPAALSGIVSKKFIFDISAFGKAAWYTGQGKSEATMTANLRRLGVGFQVTDRWKVSAGLTPFSNVGYRIHKWTQAEGSDTMYETVFTGEGGLSKFYVGQALVISRNLSVGVNFAYVFGNTMHKETTDYWTSEEKSHAQKAFFDFGLQYYADLRHDRHLTVGLVGGYRSEVSMQNSVYTYDYEGYVYRDKTTPSNTQHIPAFYGIGLSLASRKVTIGIDYLFQQWSGIDSGAKSVKYKDMNKITAGISYTANKFDARYYRKRITYQFGVTADDSYLSVSGKSGINFSVSAGMVFPLSNFENTIHFGVEYGRNSTPAETRIAVKENFVKATIGITFRERWFERKQYH